MPSARPPALDVTPLGDAIARLSGKSPLGAKLKSADWERVPLAIRERSQFSATVESARILSNIQSKLDESIGAMRVAVTRPDGTPDTVLMSRERFRADMGAIAREEMGEAPRKGGLHDIRSIGRLNLIFDQQTADANGFAAWKVDTDPENLNAVPAQEFLRVEPRRVPRDDWGERWKRAGGKIIDGRMVALKTDPVWMALSRFGHPWPPYDYGSGMGVRDVFRNEAEAIGLVERGQRMEATQQRDFNDAVEASMSDMVDRRIIKGALKALGKAWEYAGGKFKRAS